MSGSPSKRSIYTLANLMKAFAVTYLAIIIWGATDGPYGVIAAMFWGLGFAPLIVMIVVATVFILRGMWNKLWDGYPDADPRENLKKNFGEPVRTFSSDASGIGSILGTLACVIVLCIILGVIVIFF